MNQLEAQEIDKKWNLLLGDQGEYDFCLAHSRKEINDQLINYAEECDGCYTIRKSYTDVHTACDESYRIYFAEDESRCLKVDVFDQNGNLHRYWDEQHQRKIDSYYQASNINEPLLKFVGYQKIG